MNSCTLIPSLVCTVPEHQQKPPAGIPRSSSGRVLLDRAELLAPPSSEASCVGKKNQPPRRFRGTLVTPSLGRDTFAGDKQRSPRVGAPRGRGRCGAARRSPTEQGTDITHLKKMAVKRNVRNVKRLAT